MNYEQQDYDYWRRKCWSYDSYKLSGEDIASEIVLIDINKDKVEGEVMDIKQGPASVIRYLSLRENMKTRSDLIL